MTEGLHISDPESGDQTTPRQGRTMADIIADGWGGFRSGLKSAWSWTRSVGFLIIVGIGYLLAMATLWRYWGAGPTFTGFIIGIAVLPLIVIFVKVWHNVVFEVGMDTESGELILGGWKVPVNLWHEVRIKGFAGIIRARGSGSTWSLVRSFNPKTKEGIGLHPTGYSWAHFLADAKLFTRLLDEVETNVQGYWRGLVQARLKLLKDRYQHGQYMDEALFSIEQNWVDGKDPHEGKEAGVLSKAPPAQEESDQ